MIKYEWMGIEHLARALQNKSESDFDRVQRKNLLQMRDRAVSSGNPASGGAPRDTGELRLSAHVDSGGDAFGFTKDYAPHVEYGHRTVSGGFVPGQYYLRSNVNIQQPIFKSDLVEEMRK